MSRPHAFRPVWFALLPAALLSLSIICSLTIPANARAQGNDFFSCTDRQGHVTITNRHYDPGMYTCRPFSNLNASFRRAETIDRSAPRTEPARRIEAGGVSAAESARVSAESARMSMEAAQTAAQAAYITAEAVNALLAPRYYYYYIFY